MGKESRKPYDEEMGRRQDWRQRAQVQVSDEEDSEQGKDMGERAYPRAVFEITIRGERGLR